MSSSNLTPGVAKTMTILKSEDWSQAHMDVTEALSSLTNRVRDHGYNPSLHVHYDGEQHRLVLDEELLNKHEDVRTDYERYLKACDMRDAALVRIQEMPKLDIGF